MTLASAGSSISWMLILLHISRNFCQGQTPTPAPTEMCTPALAELVDCLEGDGHVEDDCLVCIEEASRFVMNETTCGELTALVCKAIDGCTGACGTCGPSYATFKACLWGPECFGACPSAPSVTPAPTPRSATASLGPTNYVALCASEFSTLEECASIQTDPDAVWQCQSCVYFVYHALVRNATRPAPTCVEIKNVVCSAMSVGGECGCQECYDEIRQTEACQIGYSLTGCEITCGGDDGSPPAPAPSASSQAPDAAPTPSAGGGEGGGGEGEISTPSPPSRGGDTGGASSAGRCLVPARLAAVAAAATAVGSILL